MDEKQFGKQIADLRRARGLTQEALAVQLRVSPQAVSKWENGHSLPETALLPDLARALDTGIEVLFSQSDLVILQATFGDGLSSVDVTHRLNRLVQEGTLSLTVLPALLGADAALDRPAFLLVQARTPQGLVYIAAREGQTLGLSAQDLPTPLPAEGLQFAAGGYGTRQHSYDVMPRLAHLEYFDWDGYDASDATFPSNPANDGPEYLTLVYLNAQGLHAATCREGERLVFSPDKASLFTRPRDSTLFIPDVPSLPPFGQGMECSWGAALTAALQAMGVATDYDEVMGSSGACYRLAFSTPVWDYSSVDGLVAYDYATPGYAAFGYTPTLYGHIAKEDRPEHRQRILRELQSGMPVLGINLRVAHEWGVICGASADAKDLYCRTKYDQEILKAPGFEQGALNPYDYLYVDNWPFLLCYFEGKRQPPTPAQNLLSSLRIFVDCADQKEARGYALGFSAYTLWAKALREDAALDALEDAQLARLFSVHQFYALALQDARGAAARYLSRSLPLLRDCAADLLAEISALFTRITALALEMHQRLDSGKALDGPETRAFWTAEHRETQAALLDAMAVTERQAWQLARQLLALPS